MRNLNAFDENYVSIRSFILISHSSIKLYTVPTPCEHMYVGNGVFAFVSPCADVACVLIAPCADVACVLVAPCADVACCSMC